jgi:very-short-patch-repair endonuclease
MDRQHWAAIVDYALGQHGLVTSRQVVEASSEAARKRALHSGLLTPVRRGVHKVAGVPASVWQPLMSVCLAAGPAVVASHRAAAGLYGFPSILAGAAEVTAMGAKTPRLAGVRAHQTGVFAPEHRHLILGIPVTSPARTIVDLAGQVSPYLLDRAVEHVLRRSLCTADELVQAFRQLAGQGRRGTVALRIALDDRLEVDSGLEARWLRVLTRAGMRPPALQHQVVVARRVLIMDFAWPAHRVGIEVDGWEPHRHRSAWDRDHNKINAYLEAGWQVLFVTSNTPETDTIRQLRSFISHK